MTRRSPDDRRAGSHGVRTVRRSRPRVLALVLAGGEGGRLELLTEHRPKPAVPYGGVYRLVDIPLSNCRHSGLGDVWVLQQHNPVRLSEHLANGRPWDLDRTYGGLLVLHPHLGADGSGWHQGNADAIYRNRDAIRGFDPDVVLCLSADHVYALDYGDVIDAHVGSEAALTMVTTQVAAGEAGRFGVVEADGDGRVTGFAYKPDEPASDVVTTEVFAWDAAALLDTLEELAGEAERDETGEPKLEDFGHGLVPRVVEAGRARAFALEGYWRDVGTPDSYLDGHLDLVRDPPAVVLDDPGWPVLSLHDPRLPARLRASARLDAALVSPGCDVAGTVERSVLSPGVLVEAGATVRDAVLLSGARVRAGAVVERTVVDSHAEIGRGASVGGAGDVTLVEQGARVEAGTQVSAGGRVGAA